MRLIVIRNGKDTPETGVLQHALSMAPLASVLLNGAAAVWGHSDEAEGGAPGNTVWVMPDSWPQPWPAGNGHSVLSGGSLRLETLPMKESGSLAWVTIINGRFAAHFSDGPLRRVLGQTKADVVAVSASPRLLAYREHVRLTSHDELVGYRRLFRDVAEPSPVPLDWPHHLFIKTECLDRALEGGLPAAFVTFLERLRSCRMTVEAAVVAGRAVDMESPGGLLAVSRTLLISPSSPESLTAVEYGRHTWQQGGGGQVSPQARFIGPVLMGDGVCVESNAIVVGPSILCDRSTVREGAVVSASILGAAAVADRGQVIRDAVVGLSQIDGATVASVRARGSGRAAHRWVRSPRRSAFRTWPRFSYPRFWKRLVDIIGAAVILVLFIPLIPFIALAIKISSPGPVFYKDRRLGFHGRPFNCVKFRTMRVGAADIQDKLRFVSEVDGPQFKMADDPRISTVGHFLRETYLDEIPQFFNVLKGQMSLVGPRPSPESENTLCPWWRDARLSVRPGITGLWQVFRTREPYRDFQEWIYYDTRYVQELSVRMDLWVCWCTFKKMVDNFIRQF